MVRGPARAAPLVEQIREHKPEILALLKAEATEIAWRVDALHPPLLPHGAIPFLVTRQEALTDSSIGCCMGCGSPLEPGRVYRCDNCLEAIEMTTP